MRWLASLLLVSGLAYADDFLDPLVGTWRVSGQIQGVPVTKRAVAVPNGAGIRLSIAQEEWDIQAEGQSYLAFRRTAQLVEQSRSYCSGGYYHFVFTRADQQWRYTFVSGRERWSLQTDLRKLPDGCWTPESTFFFER